MSSLTAKIRVKFLSRIEPRVWLRQFPNSTPAWGDCVFLFDHEERSYDWLVVYDDLPPQHGERFSNRVEPLACARQNTLLVTTEPSSIKAYGTSYTEQFGHVLTSQEQWALPHPGRIFSQPALQWFYGLGRHHELTYDHLREMKPRIKNKTISTVCSKKTQKHTLHNKRYHFTVTLKKRLPELDVYGHNVKEMDDKAESLDGYRYHIAIENHTGRNHWTEKLADPFLGISLPFYYGCTNVTDYFSEESLIIIDINDIERTLATIYDAINGNEYEKRLPYIMEARNKVLDEYNLFAVLSRNIHELHSPAKDRTSMLFSRRRSIKSSLPGRLKYAYEKSRSRLLHRLRK